MNTMMELKKQLLGPLEVRKTPAQKDAFIAFAEAFAKAHGWTMQVETSGKYVKTRNLVFGDADHAEMLLTAHYDTCARLPFPNFMTPMCWPVIILTQFILLPGLFLLLGCGAGFLMGRLLKTLLPGLNPLAAILLTAWIPMVVCLGLAALMLAGPQNPHTANDNTSGVVFILMAMEMLSGRDDVAFILFDNEEKGLLGSQAFVKAHPQAGKSAFLVQYDCISDGGTFLYTGSKAGMHSKQGRQMEAALRSFDDYRIETGDAPKVLYPSDQVVFAKGTAFASLRGKKILYLDRIHTARDTVFEDGNILFLLRVLRRFMTQKDAADLKTS